jgi:hypothetical protein
MKSPQSRRVTAASCRDLVRRSWPIRGLAVRHGIEEGEIMRCGCREPSLNEMMQDPIVKAIMVRDAVKEVELRRLMARIGAVYSVEAEPRPCSRLN